jgi:hypothetical protein
MRSHLLACAWFASIVIHGFWAAPAVAAGKAVVAVKDISVTLVGRLVEGDQEILAFRPKVAVDGLGNGCELTLEQPAGRPVPWSAVVYDRDAGASQLFLVRRQIPPAGERQNVVVQSLAGEEGPTAGPRYGFAIGDVSGTPVDPGLKKKWLSSLRADLAAETSAWADFAQFRVDQLLQVLQGLESGDVKNVAKKKPGTVMRVGVAAGRERPDPSSLAGLMDTTTGLASVHEALQIDRRLRTRFANEKPSIALASLEPPAVAQHPWKDMVAALGKKVPDEPLAHAAPASFYYVRFASLAHVFRLLDESDTWITPVASLSSGQAQNQDLGKRYETQLGLQRSQVSRLLGPQVVTDVAVVGSDAYVREGSDLTFIFRVKSPAAFQAGLASALAGHGAAHGQQTTQTIDHAGEKITVTRSQDGALKQHRADVGGFALVSNSLGAIKTVIDAIKGRAPALADALDFRYMMARDAEVPADVLAFMSDAFVAEVVGPRQKILEARRMFALSDLMAPGNAALLYGWMYGRAPRGPEDLTAAGVLGKDELRHVAGEAIAWNPGSPARSSWGTVASLTPLIDLPAPDKVTESERDAYRLFASSYQRNWSTYMDPACLRLTLDATGKHALRADFRILPIIDDSDYQKLQRSVGEARITDPASAGGALFSLGVGPRAELRKMLTDMAREMPSALRSQLDWLGEVAFVGVEDRFNAKLAFDLYNSEDHARDQDLAKLLTEAPLHAGVAVRNRLTAALTLGAIRKMVQETAPGAIEWRERGQHKGVPYVAIAASRTGEARQFAGDVTLYYAFCKDYLLLSLSEATLKSRIEDCSAGKLAKSAGQGTAGGKQSAQLVFALAMKKGGPFWQLASAGIASALDDAHRTSRHTANILVRGAPGLDGPALRRLAQDYFGNVPVDVDGSEPLAKPEIVHSHRFGHHVHAKVRIAAASESSPAGQLASAFLHARSDVAFDDEPQVKGATAPLRSLHIVLSVGGQ